MVDANTNFNVSRLDYNPIHRAQGVVFAYVSDRLGQTGVDATFSPDDVFVVWFSKTLQNWKALVATSLPDGMYYEVTYNGDNDDIYLDVYKKVENVGYSGRIFTGEST